MRRNDEFTAYVAARARLLRRSAYLLCGDWHRAEDLTQSALTKVYPAWVRVRRADNVDGYVRQVLVRTYLDEQRRRWRKEQPTGETLDGLRPDPAAASDQRLDLLRALAELPPRPRAAVVLRCWEDLPIAEVARALDCSEGTELPPVASPTATPPPAASRTLRPTYVPGIPVTPSARPRDARARRVQPIPPARASGAERTPTVAPPAGARPIPRTGRPVRACTAAPTPVPTRR